MCETKACTRCGETKPASNFGKRKLKTRWVLKSSCNKCQVEISSEWAAKNKHKITAARLARTYNLSYDDYKKMVTEQDNCCAICGAKANESVRGELHVDHCHSTGIVRGLLCVLCNTVLGKVNDDPRILEKMIDYLKNSTDKRSG